MGERGGQERPGQKRQCGEGEVDKAGPVAYQGPWAVVKGGLVKNQQIREQREMTQLPRG